MFTNNTAEIFQDILLMYIELCIVQYNYGLLISRKVRILKENQIYDIHTKQMTILEKYL